MPQPSHIVTLMAGARNLVGYCNLAAGEQVLVATGSQIDPVVTQAVLAAFSEAPVDVTQVVVPQPPTDFSEPVAPVTEAMLAADTLVDLGAGVWGHTWASFIAITEYLTKGVKVSPPASPDTFTSPAATFPQDLLNAIQLRLFELLQQPDGTLIEITAPAGTSLQGAVWQNRAGQGWGSTAGLMPGDFLMWPTGVAGFLPPKALDGIAVFESFTGYGKTSEPVTYVIENQHVARVEGGWEAAEVDAVIRAATNGDYVAEIMFGANPKSRVDLSQKPVPLEAERSPQTLHIGIGDEKLAGATVRALNPDGSTWHTDGMMVYPTLTVGSKPVLDHGRLAFLDEPGFRSLAEEFGDPDELFSYPAVIGY